jgi:hypothetical protein
LEKELAKRAQIQQSQQLTIDEYFGELQAQEKTIGELEKLNLELARRNKTLEDENAALSEIIRQQEHALNESRQRALQAEEQNTLLRAALSQLQTDLSTQQETIRALQTKLNQTQDDGKSQAAALALQINDLERNIAQKQSQIDDLSRALDQQSTDHTTQIGLLTSEIRGQQTTLEQLTNQIARYKEEQKASAARQDSEIQQKIKLLNKTIGGLEKKLPSPHRYQVEPLLRSAKKIKSSLEQITKNPDIDTLLSNEKKISEIDLKIKELKGRITELFRPKPITTVNPPKSQPDPDFNLTSLLTSLFGSSSRAPVVPPINLLETLADKLTTSSSATRFNFDKNNPLHLIKNDAGDRIQELKIFIKDPAPLSPGSLIQPAHADQFTDYLSVTEKDGAFVTSYNISSQNKTELLNEPTYQDKLNDFYEQQAATLQEAHGLDDRALLTPAKIKFEITSIADALELSSILIALNKAELKIELDLTLSQEVCNTLKQEVTSIQDPVKKDLIEKITAKHPSFINLTKELVEILKHEKSTPGITH